MVRSLTLAAAVALAAAAAQAADETPLQAKARVERQRMNDTTPADGFRYLSGNLPTAHNHPAIYASGYGDGARLTVVGNGVSRSFPMAERAEAMCAYEDLLRATGYLGGQ